MKICWVKILTAVTGGSVGAYVVSLPCYSMIHVIASLCIPGGQITPASSKWKQLSGVVLLQFISFSSFP